MFNLDIEYLADDQAIWQEIVSQTLGNITPLMLDLWDVVRTIYLSDVRQKRLTEWTRHMEMKFQVRQPDVWRTEKVSDALRSVVSFAMRDSCDLSFVGRKAEPILATGAFPFNAVSAVCLFSDGLDSLSGLIASIEQHKSGNFVAVSGITQKQVHGRIKKLHKQLEVFFGDRVKSQTIPLYRDGRAKFEGVEEDSQRSRSFLYLALGAIIAKLYGIDQVETYENGIEMFSFPLKPCPEDLLRQSRAMHPILLYRMSELISVLFEEPFRFIAPYAFRTKAEMLGFVKPEHKHLVELTQSCMNSRTGQSCGHCEGCVLRRLSLQYATFDSCEDSYKYDFCSGADPDSKKKDVAYALECGVYRLKKCYGTENPFAELMRISGLEHSVRGELLTATAAVTQTDKSLVQLNILRLYEQFIREWEGIRPQIEFLAT